MTLETALVISEQSNPDHGEWNSVVKGGKGGKNKKGKKMKNARTLTLQNFFSEHGGISPDSAAFDAKDDCYKVGLINLPELTEEETVVQTSLLSFFADLLKRLGPVKQDDLRIKSEVEAISDEGQRLIRRYANLAEFLSQDSDIAVIDDYICVQADKETAQELAMKLLMNKMELNKATDQACSSTSVWNTVTPPSVATQDHHHSDPYDQGKIKPIKPPSSSSFSSVVTSAAASVVSIPNSFPIPPPPLDMKSPPPPSLISLNNGLQCSSPTNAVSNFSCQEFESLNKRLQGLALCNADLIKQLAEKDKQIQTLTKIIDPQYDTLKKNLVLERELQEAKRELALLKSTSALAQDDSAMILVLKKQLESEKANSRNLRHQVEMERMYSAKVNEKHANLIKQLHMTSTSPVPTPPPKDSLGLRGILANAGGVSKADPDQASLSPSSSAAAIKLSNSSLFSSSAGSALLQSQKKFQPLFASFSTDFSTFGDSFYTSSQQSLASSLSSSSSTLTKSGGAGEPVGNGFDLHSNARSPFF